MIIISDNGQARAWLNGLGGLAAVQALDAGLQAALAAPAAEVSIVDAVCRSGEFIYARRADLPADVLALGAGLIAFATTWSWHGLTLDGRGLGLMSALRRDAGEPHPTGGAWPDPSEDPAPLPEFAAA